MSTEAVVKAVREAGEAGSALRIAGRGSWLDAGRPVRAERPLFLREDTGVVSYVPGDLTLTVRAGTTLAEIERVTAENDQWLPLDPYGNTDGTIGATISTGSAGPLATNFGLPRDLVLGLEFVNGRGDVIRSGGKVVKNVAGFDLTRVITGSWGTLGVITEVTLRLYARPKVDRTFMVRLSGAGKDDASFLRAFLAAPVNPFALELVSRSTARRLELGDSGVCFVRIAGNSPVVDAQLIELSRLARTDEMPADIWVQLREVERGASSVIRVSGLPARFGNVTESILGDDIPDVLTYVAPIRGTLRVIVRAPASETSGSDQKLGIDPSHEAGDNEVYETLPQEVWAAIPSSVSDPLSRGIKKAYDPYDVLNPGILGD